MTLRELFTALSNAMEQAYADNDSLLSCTDADEALARVADEIGHRTLGALGFEFMGKGMFSKAWKGNLGWGDIVIKLGYTWEGVNQPSKQELARAPMLRERLTPTLMQSKFVVVQPLTANFESSNCEKWQARFRKAADGLYSRLLVYSSCAFDAHLGNVGFYKGRMTIFDAQT